MKALVVYDSVYGNTEKIARAIAAAVISSDGVKVLRVGEANPSELESIDLLIVGSPTQGGTPTAAVKEFLRNIPVNALRDIGVIAFDTRLSATDHGVALRLLLGILDYAAGRIAGSLQGKGGYLVAPPEGFIVEGKEGPLKEGELERASAWATRILENVKSSVGR